MSLWHLLKTDKELVAYLGRLAAKPSLPSPAPELVAPPRTTHYGLVGTAFDYLLRWRLQRANPDAVARHWVAQAAVAKLPQSQRRTGRELLQRAKASHARFLRDGQLTNELLAGTIGLAQLDAVFRSGRGAGDVGTPPDRNDVEDLRAQWAAVPGDMLEGNRICMLNPTFGAASRVVGGADADFILDDILVDAKSSKNYTLERISFNQLMGYVLLARIGGVDAAPVDNLTISRIGLYLSRYGVLVSWHLADLVAESALLRATAWLRDHLPGLSVADNLARPGERRVERVEQQRKRKRRKKR